MNNHVSTHTAYRTLDWSLLTEMYLLGAIYSSTSSASMVMFLCHQTVSSSDAGCLTTNTVQTFNIAVQTEATAHPLSLFNVSRCLEMHLSTWLPSAYTLHLSFLASV